MQISFDYDQSYYPAFPVVEFIVHSPDTNQEQTIIGLIDSGSDATQIPLSILRAIGAREIDKQWVYDLSGIRFQVPIYSVEIQIGSLALHGMEVIGRNQTTEIIVGRDVLNHLIVTMNGLAYVTEVQD